MPLFLASVADVGEAAAALAAGADIIDCKNPATGVVGALAIETITAIVAAVGGRRAVSATIGDLPLDPAVIRHAAAATAKTGVDYVKLAFFPGGAPAETIAELAETPLAGARLVGMLLADRAPDLALLPLMARAGFAGAMLDTAEKGRGGLLAAQSPDFLRRFIAAARDNGLFAGLAGSLKAGDLAELLPLDPDLLGFRGALCRGAERSGRLDAGATRRLRAMIPRAARPRPILGPRVPMMTDPIGAIVDERPLP